MLQPTGFIPALSPRFPLDRLLSPYVQRLCTHVLISVPEWRRAPVAPQLPLLLDSGGFAALSPGATVEERGGLGILCLADGTEITPQDVHALQCGHAAVGFTLDFPGRLPDPDRDRLSLANARWALTQPRAFVLYASVQPGQHLCEVLALAPDGIALGGLAPHSGDRGYLQTEIRRVRDQIGPLPLHVFGLGHPESVRAAMEAGATSVDSTSPQRHAADGRHFGGAHVPGPALHERLTLAVQNLQAALEAGRGQA